MWVVVTQGDLDQELIPSSLPASLMSVPKAQVTCLSHVLLVPAAWAMLLAFKPRDVQGLE